MFPCGGFGYEFWWIFPIIMIGFCFFMMWMMWGMGCGMMGRHGTQNQNTEEKTQN
jgi:hypothetical protein